jgi:hypothetical protein
MNKFKVGDWCEVVGVQDGLVEGVGQVGEVVRAFDTAAVLRFPDRFSDKLHSGSGIDKERRCWNFAREHLRPVISIDFTPDIGSLL